VHHGHASRGQLHRGKPAALPQDLELELVVCAGASLPDQDEPVVCAAGTAAAAAAAGVRLRLVSVHVVLSYILPSETAPPRHYWRTS